jgi:hypothetical protein
MSLIDFRVCVMVGLLVPVLAAPAPCQDGGGGGVDMMDAQAGVSIDPDGVFSSSLHYDLSGDLDRQRLLAAQSKLNKEVQKQSSLRKISLNRLEAACKKLAAAGKPIPVEMRYLAGLTRLTHVFYFPETKDIVVAGPAEGFFHSSQDRVIGVATGQPVLRLDDLVVALRSYAPDVPATPKIGCSIDPTPEGLVALQKASVNAQQQIVANGGFVGISENDIASYLQQASGMHVVSVIGVSPKTHFAHVMVDADYHMKLIGIGLEQTPVRITSFAEKTIPGGKNSLQRWFFRPKYDYVKVNADETAMTLDGGTVELVCEDELVSRAGQRRQAGKGNRASRTFCASFTKMYSALAQKMLIYAELRNMVDLAVSAAFIQEVDLYGQAAWKMDFFGSEEQFPVERFDAPTKVKAMINTVWKDGKLLTPIGGGVTIQPRIALNSDNLKTDESGALEKLKREITATNLNPDQWWWD